MESLLLKELRVDSLLTLVPGLEALALEAGFIETHPEGASVAQAGTAIPFLLIPIDGGLRLFREKQLGQPVGYLEPRRSLSLRELLDGRPHRFTAMAEGPTRVLCVPAEAVVELIAADENIRRYLQLVTRSSGVRGFRDFLASQNIPRPQIFELIAQTSTRVRELSPGAVLSPEIASLFFVTRGRLEVTRADGDRIRLAEGDFFGAEAIVPPSRRSYDVTAVDAVWLYEVPLDSIKGLAERHGLTEALYDEPCLRLTRGQAAPTDGLTDLDGTPLDAADLEWVRDRVDPRAVALAETDQGSIRASVSNIASLLGVAVNPARIEAGLELVDVKTMLRMAEQLEPFGLICRAAEATYGELSDERLPALTWFGPRLVVLLAADAQRVVLLDPGRGFVEVTRSAFERRWPKSILEVARDTHEEKDELEEAPPSGAKLGRGVMRRTWKLLGESRGLLANLIGLSLLGLGLNLLAPLFLRSIFDSVLLLGSLDMATALIAGLFLTAVFSALTSLATGLVASEYALRFDRRLSTDFYRHALQLPTEFYRRGKVGDVLVRLAEVSRIRDFFSTSTIRAVFDLVSVVVYAFALGFFSPSLGVAGLAMAAGLVVTQLAGRRMLRRLYRREFSAKKKATGLIAELFSAIGTSKATHAEDVLRARWESAYLDALRTRRRLGLRENDLQTAADVLGSVGTVAVLWLACSAALSGSMSLGSIMAAAMYLQSMLTPIDSLTHLLSEFEETRVGAEKLEEVFEAESEEAPARALVTHTVPLRGKIRLESVSFRYAPESHPVLRDVDLTIYPGQVVAIVGRSGSGKTTLARMIAGLDAPSAGRIFYDDYDGSMLSLPSLRRQIGFVQQTFDLFEGTLRDNITHVDDAPDETRLAEVARLAHVDEFAEGFPGGYEHFLAARGLGLSGGQKQRIAIARVLYSAPRILIMDEAFSSLDADSETAIAQNMSEIARHRTTIVIAHRLSTVRHADRILVLDRGTIVEDGTHDALLRRGGKYADLFEGQLDYSGAAA